MEKREKAGKRVFFVIPAYNEARSISKVVKGLKKAGYKDIVVVDDCSRDRTFQEAKRERIFVLRHIINRGQGAAIRTGMDFALKQGADVIVHFDSDGQHRVEDLPAMVRPVLDGEVDVTLGSRFLKKTKMPLARRILLKGSVLIQWMFYGVWLSDAHNGFRVLSRKAAQRINITSDRMEHASEIVEEIVKKRISYREVPVVIKYTSYSQAKGTASFLGALRILGKMIFKKLIG
ncbi:glycosyltransferase family 2 protein [Candidatus Woesearchaeota archaeon]|nr:glycosyltransferase family 2 protein [Candidatus Woesearchaeota archaeon]